MAATIGVFAMGLEAYWAQFPGMREALLGQHERFVAKLKGQDVIATGLVDTPARAREAASRFRQGRVDLLVCHLTTYASSESLLHLIRELQGIPVLLANVQSVPALDLDRVETIGDWLGAGCSCAGLPEMTAVLRRAGRTFAVLSGYLEGDTVLDAELAQWCAAAGARARLRSGNIGLLGRPYPGMMDLNLDETRIFERFGSQVRHLNWEDLASPLEGGDNSAALEAAGRCVRAVFDLPSGSAESEITEIATVLLAAERLVAEHRLIALANHFETQPTGALQTILAASNPVFSLLMRDGVACPVEADVKAAIAMTVLKAVGGSATLAELYSMDFTRDVCLIGHSGAADPMIAAERGTLRKSAVFHGKPGGGFLTQFSPAPGPVTLLSLAQDRDGEYRFIVAEGEIVPGKVLRLGDTNAPVRFRQGVREFVDAWANHGPTHHATLGRGHHAAVLGKAAKLLDVPIERV